MAKVAASRPAAARSSALETAAARATVGGNSKGSEGVRIGDSSVEGCGGGVVSAVEWLATARELASGTAAARATEDGSSKGSGVRSAAAMATRGWQQQGGFIIF